MRLNFTQCLIVLSILSVTRGIALAQPGAKPAGVDLAPTKQLVVYKDNWLKQVAIRGDGKQVAVADSYRVLHLISVDKWQEEKKFEVEGASGSDVTDLAYLPGEQGFLVGLNDPERAVVQVNLAGKTIRKFDTANEHRGKTMFAVFPAKKLLVAIWGNDAFLAPPTKITLWNYETGELIKSIDGWPQPNSILFAPDGKTILYSAAGSPKADAEGARIHSFSSKDLSLVGAHERENGQYLYIAISPDGKKLAVSHEEDGSRKADIWRTNRMTAVHQLIVNETDFTSDFTQFAFTPDSSQLITCEQFKDDDPFRMRLWNTAKGTLIANLTGHTAKTYCSDLALSTDGQQLFSIDSVGILRRWDLGGLKKK